MLTTADKKWVKKTASEIVHDEITQLIVDYIQPTLATKNDLKTLATKDDLRKFATKAELNDFRDEMKGSLNEIQNTLDHFLGEMRDSRQEHDVVSYRVYRDHAPKLEDHEKRISKIESHPRMISSAV